RRERRRDPTYLSPPGEGKPSRQSDRPRRAGEIHPACDVETRRDQCGLFAGARRTWLHTLMQMERLTAFGLFAVTAMLITMLSSIAATGSHWPLPDRARSRRRTVSCKARGPLASSKRYLPRSC